jgi:hypothetical protein
MERSNIFFQNQMFSHRVAFIKCLHKGLRPFTGAGLHKKGVRLQGDDWWGQLARGMFTVISWGAFQVQISFPMTLFYSSTQKKV